MTKIRILPEILSNKIAAGEVVERPASVVKELVENSLDAGSSRILIEIEKGGRSLIRISDNGCGMSRDDAILSIERYATSKIYSDEDLFSIHTLGFRGEALPSIASVSRLNIISRESSAESGTEIVMEGGKILRVSDAGSPVGTQITVRKLFFNIPARLKFLKTIRTEMGHISDIVSNMALGWPNVQFKLTHDGSVIQNWPSSDDHKARIAKVLGDAVENNLFPISAKNEEACLSGWISLPGMTRSTSQEIYVFVNGRFVRDKMIIHALMDGYSCRLMKGQFPSAVLFISVPFGEVDVNVHPSKQEIRFFRRQQIYEMIVDAVSSCLVHNQKPSWAHHKPEGIPVISEAISQAEKRHPYIMPFSEMGKQSVHDTNSTYQPPGFSGSQKRTDQAPLWETSQPENLKAIGQFFDSYILCESGANLFLLDQHAAHERILFEKLADRTSGKKLPAQRMLIPETLDLNYRQAHILERLIPDLEKYGIEIELFGKQSFVIKSSPVMLSGKEIKPLIIEMVDTAIETGIDSNMEKTVEDCLKLMACHGAIRASQTLSTSEMTLLITELEACKIPAHCPHGRPTWIKWQRQEIEKLFKRT